MPYPINTGDIVQVNVSYFQNQVVQEINTFHYRLTSGGPVADGAQAITVFLDTFFNNATSTQWPNAWAGVSSSEVAVSEVRGQHIWPTRHVPVPVARQIPGISIQPSFPGPVQWTISRSGEVSTKGAVGGLRIPGLPHDAVSDSRLTPAFMTAAESLRSFVTTPKILGSVTWSPIIFKRAAPDASQLVAFAIIRPEVRTQRTRVSLRGI